VPLFICRWQNGDFSAANAPSKQEAIVLLDEVGNADVCEIFTVKNFMVHFHLKQEVDDLDQSLPVGLEGPATLQRAGVLSRGSLTSQARPHIRNAEIPYQFRSISYQASPWRGDCG